MTVIVAVSDGKRVCMAGDSQGNNGGAMAILTTPKIFRAGRMLFGADGTFAIVQAIQYHMNVPGPGIEDLAAYAAMVYVPFLRSWLKESGHIEKHADGSELFPG